MNEDAFSLLATGDIELINCAVHALRGFVALHSEVHPHKERKWDALVHLEIEGRRLKYDCKVKTKIDRHAVLRDMKARGDVTKASLLVTSTLSNELAATCRELGIQFIDTAGNAFINDGNGLYIFISGRRADDSSRFALEGSTITPAALRMMFAFLADPSMLNAAYRDISVAVRVSTGAIGKVFETLEARGFIAKAPNGKRIIAAPDLLLSEWATGYLGRLKPKLKTYRFRGPSPAEFSARWNPGYRESAWGWGGEAAAAIQTGHLKPETCTVYIDMDAPGALHAMVKDFKLKADPSGPIEIVHAFWNMDFFTESFPTVPLPLIYADLLGTNDSRNLAVAKLIAAEVLQNVRS
ncbi:type IV toxin-antitoxin system AbiEi family antitoxin [Massilia cavernae]|uniref:Restriction endonuclease type IV Mrr domain-containing protein n=1 Tax=Massilia cavernae TaxID=2320864 RepID=A0A418XTS3_9BURK|nr:type IV toxin-antitoxin system AbiEi family antitoxin [Massilia cavernae]RJG16083.1 hypothetical protein D3872_11340 [Massilia cavernae]